MWYLTSWFDLVRCINIGHVPRTERIINHVVYEYSMVFCSFALRLWSCSCFNFAIGQLHVTDTTRHADWKRHRKSKPYWSREVVLMDRQTWLQYRVNRNPNADREAHCIITCKKAFITASGRRSARKTCKKAAARLASHLKPTRPCACDFESLMSGQECVSEGKRWWKGRATNAIRSYPKAHDSHCACDCFEFP